MPPRREPPPLEESMAAMIESIGRLITSSNENIDRIIASQAATIHDQKTNIDVIVNQLAAQYEQTNTLLTTIAQKEPKTPRPNHPPQPPPGNLPVRPPKLTPPTFDGSNPLDWLFQADQYFTFYNIPHPQRLSMIDFILPVTH